MLSTHQYALRSLWDISNLGLSSLDPVLPSVSAWLVFGWSRMPPQASPTRCFHNCHASLPGCIPGPSKAPNSCVQCANPSAFPWLMCTGIRRSFTCCNCKLLGPRDTSTVSGPGGWSRMIRDDDGYKTSWSATWHWQPNATLRRMAVIAS